MPLAAPPGPLWTADAKEPHPTRRRSLRRHLFGRSARRARDRRLRWRRPDGPRRSPPADVSLERHASGGGPDERTRRRVTCVPVRSWPRWSRGIPTEITRGIGHGHARVFMESHWQQGGLTRSWRLPHRTPRIAVRLTGCVRYIPSACTSANTRAPTDPGQSGPHGDRRSA